MALGGGRAETVWRFPASGFAATALVASAPGSPWGPGGWPTRGAFGAFTWTSWFVTAGLAATLLLLAAASAARRGGMSAVAGRAASAALTFGLLALSAFAAASHAVEIERSPAAAMAVAVAGLVVLRALGARVAAPVGAGPGADLGD